MDSLYRPLMLTADSFSSLPVYSSRAERHAMPSHRRWAALYTLLILLGAMLWSVEATNWMRKSDLEGTPSWRLQATSRAKYAVDGTLIPTSSMKREALPWNSFEEDEDLDTKTILELSKRMEGLGEPHIEPRISNGSLRSLIVHPDVNLDLFKNILRRVLAHSPLVEAEILHPKADLDLSRQTSLQRLAIDASMLSSLPLLPKLEELVVQSVTLESLALIQNFSQVSRLTLSGIHSVTSQLDASSFHRLSHLDITSSGLEAPSESERRSTHSEKLFSSARASAAGASLTYRTNASTTNTTLQNDLCGYLPASLGVLIVDCTSTVAWLQLPTCYKSWTALTYFSTVNCMMPDFSALPASVNRIYVASFRGATWVTQSQTMTNLTVADASYFDWSWLNGLPGLNSLVFGQCPIGTLPNRLSHSNLSILQLTATDSNQFTGTMAPSFFLQYPALTDLALSYNSITGTFPNYGLQSLTSITSTSTRFTHWPPLIVNSTAGFAAPANLGFINLSYNTLVQIPSEADFRSMKLRSLYIGNNLDLTGTLPDIFNTVSTRNTTTLVNRLSAGNTRLSGTVPGIPIYLVSLYAFGNTKLDIIAPNALLVGTLPTAWNTMAMGYIDLSGNAGINGTVATVDAASGRVTSQFVKSATSIYLSGSGLTGPMFNITSMAGLTELSMVTPSVDFCASTRTTGAQFSAPLTYCSLITTNASYCTTAYPSVCLSSPWAAPPPVTPLPVAPPTAPTTSPAETPVTSPLTAPETIPTQQTAPIETCPMPSPGPSFVCEGTIWVSHDSVTEQTITLPPASTTTINGNLTTTSIVITSASSSINVTGCVTTSDGKTPMITIVLTQSDLEELVKSGGKVTTEVVHQGQGCAAISSSSLNVDSSGIKSCKSVSTDKIDTGTGFAATFTVHTSKCNVWWIVLVSVLCVLALLGVITTIIMFKVCSSKARDKEQERLAA